MNYEFPWKVRDKKAFQRSVAETFPNGELLARAIVEKFDADLRVHVAGWAASKLSDQVEQVWEYGGVSVRYRLLPATQQVEVLAVYETPRVSRLAQWGLRFLHLLRPCFQNAKPAAQQKD
jgi:hypothetical protein